MKYWRRLWVVLALSVSQNVIAGSDEGGHPLVGLYPGAKVTDSRRVAYEEISIYAGPADAKRRLLGDQRKDAIEVTGVSTLKVYQNYLDAFKKAGFSVVFQCEVEACGDSDEAKALGKTIAVKNVYNYYDNPYYLVVEKPGKKGTITIAQFIGGYNSDVLIQQLVVEAEPLELGLVKVDANYIKQDSTDPSLAKTIGVAQENDHPLLPRYPGAKLATSKKSDYEQFGLPVVDASADVVVTELNLTGDLQRHNYEIANVSTLKVYQNYRSALDKAGFTVVSECLLEGCGTAEQVKVLGNKLAINSVYNYYSKPYFLVGQKDNTYIGLFFGAYEDQVGLQQVILEVEALEQDLVQISLDGLKNQLDDSGKALIYGIFFDTDKADIKAESKPTLDVIAEFLRQYKDVSLYVVGHTDDTGSLARNLQLSEQRSAAVVAELVRGYQIEPARLTAKGVGPFAPAGSNTSEVARSKNRRVELVKRLAP